MKINVEFDLTPEEFRRALGLPDVEAFQQELLNRIQKQMESGVEGYDPMSLMKPFLQQGFTQDMSQGLSQGLASFGTYQQMMLDMLRQAGSSMGKAAQEPAADGESKRAERPASNTGTAKARSRSRRSE
ncbi:MULTISPECIES: DUF6489 family protein [Halomonadaceae]|jgi:hypothetical protein|uniref:Rod binding protein n=1 Tax=Billgrantia aerodenitrificans TaxID=2733483 RepID=A0ABS9ARV8_9GAMM|nr:MULTISPECIES: DUF6489 family protein [Halomonas]MCE8024495.1 hypothetical protein [Halomonas aerodenitrificans]MCE8036621.1 hypothetical protein [Halomonas sp. MCCC 1A11062]